MKYLLFRQTAEKWDLSIRWINDLCNTRRIPGSMKFGIYWATPLYAKKADDQQIKNGLYIKSEKYINQKEVS